MTREEIKEAFCLACCESHPHRATCQSLGTCAAYDRFIRLLKNPWHKASEELPTHFGDYLVVIESQQFGRRYALKCWYGYPKDFFGDNPSKEWALEDDEIVSYWMEIPKLPKED